MAKIDATENITADENELVTIQLPLTREKMDDVFVGINGNTWKIKRGEPVEVPRYVKEVLDNSEAMDMEALKRSMKLQGKIRDKELM